MEAGEERSQGKYEQLSADVPESIQIRQQEDHEGALLGMLGEERLQYVGSMVLGLNDALVELTGFAGRFYICHAKHPPDCAVRPDHWDFLPRFP